MAQPTYGTAFLSIRPDLNTFSTALQAGVLGGGAGGLLGTVGKAGGLLLGGALVAGVGAVIGGGALLAGIGETFDEAFDKIRIGTGTTGSALEGLQQDFENVFKAVPTDAQTAATAITELSQRLGLTGGNLSELAKQFLELSRITETDLTSNITEVTRAFGDWGITVDDQTERLDQLFRASQVSGINVDQLASSLVQFGAPLRQLGFSFDVAAATIAQFEKEGVNTELVLGSMRIALGKLARAGEPAQETFERIVADIANVGTVSEANALALELFGARAGPDMAAAIREGRFDIKDLYNTIANGEDTIEKAAEDTNDWKEALNVLKNRVLVALEPLARRVFDGIGNAIEDMTPHIEAFVEWFSEKAVPAIEEFWNRVQPIFAGLGSLVSTAFGFVGDLFGIFDDPVSTESLDGVAGVFDEINTAAGPLEELLGGVAGGVGDVVDAIGEVSGTVFDTVATSVREAAAAIIEANAGIATNTKKTFGSAGGVLSQFAELFTTVADDFAIVWGEVGDDIIGAVAFAFEGITGRTAAALEFMRGLMEIFLGFITGDWIRIWEGMGISGQAIFDGLKATVQAAVNQILAIVGVFVPDIRDRFLEGFRAFQGGLRNFLIDLERTIRAIPGKIVEWLRGGEAPMKNVGAKTMQGFLDGIQSKFEPLRLLLQQLTKFIPSWKGPADRDATLLVSAGEAIIQGLIDGIEDAFPQVRALLNDLSDEVASTVFDPIDISVVGADDPGVLDRVRRATSRVAFDTEGAGGVHIDSFQVNNPIGEPTEESVQTALLEVAISPIVNRLVSAGSST